MGRGFIKFFLVVLALYASLHVLLGTQPVQQRVLEEVKTALLELGLELQVESIEFTPFSSKIYLNRVTVRTTKAAPFALKSPLEIDKIKLHFQPLALISRQIMIQEAILFHPRINVPEIDILAEKIEKFIEEKAKKKTPSTASWFDFVVKKAGVVDALFEIGAPARGMKTRSRSFTAYVENVNSRLQTITVETNHLEIEHAKTLYPFTRVRIRADVSKKNIHLTDSFITLDGAELSLKGVANLPVWNPVSGGSGSLSYQIRLHPEKLEQFPELHLPDFGGSLVSSGDLKLAGKKVTGNGKVSYDQLLVDGYPVGSGTFGYRLHETHVQIADAKLKYAGGEVVTNNLKIDLKNNFPISGDLNISHVSMPGILENVNSPVPELKLLLNGELKVAGNIGTPLKIGADVTTRLNDFAVLADSKKSAVPDNTVVSFKTGTFNGNVNVTTERLQFRGKVHAVDSDIQGEGTIQFDAGAKVAIRSDNFSLTALKNISDVSLFGKGSVQADVDVLDDDVKVAGSFDVTNAGIMDLELGNVKGQVQYQNDLMSFVNLEMQTSIEPVKGTGFLDFKKEKTHYKFSLDSRRVAIDEVIKVFRRDPPKIPLPSGGEMGARVSIEGGHDPFGIEVIASGHAKTFNWYDEKWMSSHFALNYRPDSFEVPRILLLKKSGGLELRGRFVPKDSKLTLISRNLHLEEIDYFGKSPLSGEIVGQMTLAGNLERPAGTGELQLTKSVFRGQALPNSSFRLRQTATQTEAIVSLVGDRLRARILRDEKKDGWQMLTYFRDFDFNPFLHMFMKKDLPTLVDLTATGDVTLRGKGYFERPGMGGSGTIQTLNLGLKGTPMKNRQPIVLNFEEGVARVSRFNLVGKDSQLSAELNFEPQKLVKFDIDTKLDLQFLQPFIPSLEYGNGKLSAGIRVSGRPQNFSMFGNVSLEDGTFRLAGIADEFRSAQMQLSLSQDKINVDRFESLVNGGRLKIGGDVRIDKFNSLSPNLKLTASKIGLHPTPALALVLSGDFAIKGNEAPYQFGGKCQLLEGRLTQFDAGEKRTAVAEISPSIFKFDINCDSKEKLSVNTEIMNAEFKGNFQLVGNENQIGLLGTAEALHGSLLFRETKFNLISGNVKFESSTKIAPRFNVSGRALVKESKGTPPQEYEVNLQVFGVPSDYRLRLTSTPTLLENDIISLLVLGVTSKGQDANYVDLGTTLVGQSPFQSKLQSEFGVDIKINTQSVNKTTAGQAAATTPTQVANANTDVTVPSVRIQKEITKKTKLTYSNTLETYSAKEFKIEHMLNDNFTVNGTAVDKVRGSTDTQSVQSYGLDFRYRFEFE